MEDTDEDIKGLEDLFDDNLIVRDDDVRNTKVYEHQIFAERALQLGNASQAAKSLGIGVTNTTTKAALAYKSLMDRRRNYLARLRLDSVNVLNELARIAFFDIRNLLDDEGKPMKLSELDEETAAAIAGIKVSQLGKEEGFAQVVEYKIADKLRALESLAKNLGLFKEQVDVNLNANVAMSTMSKTEKARRLAFMIAEGVADKQKKTPKE